MFPSGTSVARATRSARPSKGSPSTTLIWIRDQTRRTRRASPDDRSTCGPARSASPTTPGRRRRGSSPSDGGDAADQTPGPRRLASRCRANHPRRRQGANAWTILPHVPHRSQTDTPRLRLCSGKRATDRSSRYRENAREIGACTSKRRATHSASYSVRLAVRLDSTSRRPPVSSTR